MITGHVSVDFETFFSKKLKYTLRSMHPEQYCRSDLFEPYLISVSDGKQCWAGHPNNFTWSALEGKILVSHNRAFDNTVFNEMVRRKLAPPIQYKEWHCTANLTSYLCNRRALKDAVKFLFKADISKDYRDTAEGKHWSDWNEAERQQIIKAGQSDSLWCWKIWSEFSEKWPHIEKRASQITIEQCMRGVQINTELLNDYIVQTHEMLMNAEKAIPWIQDDLEDNWDEFNTSPTSSKCINEQCRRVGIPGAPIKNEDQEAYENWETQYAPQHPWIYAVGAWRQINRLYKSFLTVKERVRPDGSMPFGLKYFGAISGRWSGDSKLNFQNFRKKPLLCNEYGQMEASEMRINSALQQNKKTGKYPEWVRHSIDFRALIIPRPGKKMIACDLSQVEPRILAWLSGNKALLEMIRGGMGVYQAFARTALGFVGPYDKTQDYYGLHKIQVLGLGYGAGWEKFVKIALDGGVDLCKDDPEFVEVTNPFTGEVKQISGYGQTSKKIVKLFRDSSPLLADSDKGIWAYLDRKFRSSLASDFVMTLPSGRKMTYRDIKVVSRIEKDPETGVPKRKTEFTAEVNGRRAPYYGGKLTAELTQGTARDAFTEQIVRCVDQRNWPCLFHVHDEGIFECDQDVMAHDIELEMSKTPDWLPGCPIAAEARELPCYTK